MCVIGAKSPEYLKELSGHSDLTETDAQSECAHEEIIFYECSVVRPAHISNGRKCPAGRPAELINDRETPLLLYINQAISRQTDIEKERSA